MPLHISQRGFGLFGLGLVSSLFMGSSLTTPAYQDYRQLWRAPLPFGVP